MKSMGLDILRRAAIHGSHRGRELHSFPPARSVPSGRAIRIGSNPRMRTSADHLPRVGRHPFDNARGALLLSAVAGPVRGNTRRANSAAGAVFPRRAGRISLRISLRRHKPGSYAAQDFAERLPGLLGWVGFHTHNHGANRWKNLSGLLSEKFRVRA